MKVARSGAGLRLSTRSCPESNLARMGDNPGSSSLSEEPWSNDILIRSSMSVQYSASELEADGETISAGVTKSCIS
eukprot:1932816-Prymnesium_polylepis.1